MKLIKLSEAEPRFLEIYTKVKERQLLHYHEPFGGLFIAESLRITERALDAGYEPVSMFADEEVLKSREAAGILERCKDIPVFCASHEEMIRLIRYEVPRGVLCAMKRKEPPALTSVLTEDVRRVAVLEDIMNPTNVGAIFRSAAALGMDAVLLTPGCADPLYRRAARVSMGTVFQIPWTYLKEEPSGKRTEDIDQENRKNDTEDKEGNYVSRLKAMGFQTVAMALRSDTIAIDDERLARADKLAIILGTEGDGLKEASISACDYTVCIPMYHGVDSLNVAAASAVAFWELRRKNP